LTENIYRHTNGLKHINVINDEDFSALFVVNTPVFDNSGVAHAVEHMVFRRSDAFPKAETLFQITSLTDVKINASTFANTTYFHCQSHCYDTFLLAITYLIHGLFTPNFNNDDLRQEVHNGDKNGVIYRELLGSENIQNSNNEKKEKSEFSYGGLSESIGKLSLSDIKNFHQRYYQASNITLITANADVDTVSDLLLLLPQQNKHTKKEKTPLNNNKVNLQYCENNEQHLKKYSPAIKKLITIYQLWLQDPYYQEIDDFQTVENSSESESIPKVIEINNETYQSKINDHLIAPLVNLSHLLTEQSKVNQPENEGIKTPINLVIMPSLFTKLYQQATKQLVKNKKKCHSPFISSHDQHNALWLTEVSGAEQALASITSYILSAYPLFLARRCQGHCYATQALTVEKSTYLVIYSAFDVNPVVQLQSITQNFISLSQDPRFIQQSLLMAKIKYSKTQQVNMKELKHITANDVIAYLQALSTHPHPKV
jgi:Zn-dependent M16 (insulinase) family peptidase